MFFLYHIDLALASGPRSLVLGRSLWAALAGPQTTSFGLRLSGPHYSAGSVLKHQVRRCVIDLLFSCLFIKQPAIITVHQHAETKKQ